MKIEVISRCTVLSSSIATIIAQSRGGAIQSFELVPLDQRAANALISYAIYIGKMLWPSRLIAHYYYEPLPGWKVVLSLSMLILISGAAFRVVRRYPFILAGWLWFLVTLLPVIGLIQVGAQSRADRYTYVPIIGLFIIAAWGFPELIRGRRHHRIGIWAVSGILVCILTIAARHQVGYWISDIALWEHAVQTAPGNCFARINLGTALESAGDVTGAINQYTEALRILPESAEAHNAPGAVLVRQGLWREALPHYSEALRLKPGFGKAHSNMGTVLAAQGKTEEALSEFREALRISPQNAEMHYNLGFALAHLGKLEDAIAQYQAALEIRSSYAEACTELGNVFFMQGKFGEAVKQYNLEPGD